MANDTVFVVGLDYCFSVYDERRTDCRQGMYNNDGDDAERVQITLIPVKQVVLINTG